MRLLTDKPILFCFPFAGGTSAIFHGWQKLLPQAEIIPLDYPGHGRRYLELLIDDCDTLVELFLNEMKEYLERPYLFFGHSLGAIIAYELASKLQTGLLAKPLHLIVSGSGAPQFPDRLPPIGHLAPTEFLLEVQRRYRGFSESILNEKELLEIILPIVQNDFNLAERYQFKERRLLSCPITALVGKEDDMILESELEGWRDLTQSPFQSRYLLGDHFSLFKDPQELIRVISLVLTNLAHPNSFDSFQN